MNMANYIYLYYSRNFNQVRRCFHSTQHISCSYNPRSKVVINGGMMLATLWRLHKYFMSNSRNQGKGNFNDSKINNLMYYSRNFALLQQPTCIIRKRTLNFYWKGSLAENTPLKTLRRDWLALMIRNLSAYPCQLRFSMIFPIL